MLRPAHLAYYKTSAEYQLLRLLELADVHSCTPVALKKHENTFGLISPVRTFYLQAETQAEVQAWVNAIEEARESLTATSTQNSITSPITIPNARTRSNSRPLPPVTPSPPSHPSHSQNITSSDSEDASPSRQRTHSLSQNPAAVGSSPVKALTSKDPAKVILTGYLMKCGSKRRNWRKRWFVLNGEKLVYSGSHMVKSTLSVVANMLPDHIVYAGHQTPPAISVLRDIGRPRVRSAIKPSQSRSHITDDGIPSSIVVARLR